MTKYFIGGIPIKATEDDVRSEFSKFGIIRDVVLSRDRITNKPRGFGFLSFVDKIDLIPPGQQSVYGYNICGRPVELKFAAPRNEEEARETGIPYEPNKRSQQHHDRKDTQPPPPMDWDRCVVIRGFPSDATSADLYSYFSCFGHVGSVEFQDGNALVVFQDSSLVDMIVQEAKGNNLTMGDKILHAEAGNEYAPKVIVPNGSSGVPNHTGNNSNTSNRTRPRSPPPQPPPNLSSSHPTSAYSTPPPPLHQHQHQQPMAVYQQQPPQHQPPPPSISYTPPPYPSTPLYAVVPVTILPPMHPSLNKYVRIVHWGPSLEESLQRHLEVVEPSSETTSPMMTYAPQLPITLSHNSNNNNTPTYYAPPTTTAPLHYSQSHSNHHHHNDHHNHRKRSTSPTSKRMKR
eukprot:PhF_6_TR12884/c0_g1_i4/m.20273